MPQGGYRPGSGRKPGLASIEAEKARNLIAQRLSENLNPIISKAVEQASNGDDNARKWLADRAWGRAKETVEVQTFELFDDDDEEDKFE